MAQIQFKGKTFVQNHHLLVKYHELVPVKSKSLTDKVSLHDNLIIHGDNLKALKALLPLYAGKIKCIYIDPPYNIGNENWAYNDNVNSPMMQDWLGKVVDREDLTRHDKWLCMMMPRLRLLRELLANEGVIFISIDENEEHHLRILCDEIFGAENFIEKVIWNKRIPKNDKGIGNIHEYILIYVKDSSIRHKFKMPKDGTDDVYEFVAQLKKKKVPIDKAEEQLKKFYIKKGYDRGVTLYCNLDEQYRIWGKINISWPNAKDGPRYDVLHPKTKKPTRVPENGWRYKKETFIGYLDYENVIKRHDGSYVCGQMWFAEDEKTQPSFIQYLDNVKDFLFRSIISLKSSGGSELDEILPGHSFPHPKTYRLIKKLLQTIEGKDFIALDSCAGSGTTAHASLALNEEDGGNRRFILIECEDYADKITAERVRRVIKGVPSAKDGALKKGLDGSFSFFELGKSIELESILDGKNLPTYKELARYVFYTATGEEFDEDVVDEKKNFIGESKNYQVFLFYLPDIEKLKNMAFTLEMAKGLPALKKGKRRLVFAPTKYLDQEHLEQNSIDFAQLPFEIYETTR